MEDERKNYMPIFENGNDELMKPERKRRAYQRFESR